MENNHMPLRKLISTFLIAGALVVPSAAAPGIVGACRQTCKQQYQFCMKRSTTKAAQKSCAVARKMCKGGCVVKH